METAVYIHESAYVDEGAQLGAGVKVWHFSHIMSGATIGDRCIIGQNVMIGNKVVLGQHVKVQNNVSVYEGVVCEDDVFIGPSVVFTNVINPRSAIERKDQFRATLVKRGATIGANATVICGHTIGSYAMIGAGAVVTKDILDHALVVGNPAKQIGWVSVNGHRLHFDTAGFAKCPESKEVYELKENRVQKRNML